MGLKAIALLLGFCFAVFMLVGSGYWPLLAPAKPNREATGAIGPPADNRALTIGSARDSAASSGEARLPQFDVVRVEPSGATVVAGRARPSSNVALLSGAAVLAEGSADSAGYFVLQPQPLPPGDYSLRLLMRPPAEKPSISLQSITVSVPEKGGGQVMVALAEPGAATVLLSDPTEAQAAKMGHPNSKSEAPAVSGVAFKTAEVAPDGRFFASGIAKPRVAIRLYLDGTPLSQVEAGVDGRWSLRIAKSLATGRHALRADEIDAATGAVASRAEIPFELPADAPSGRRGAPAGQSETTTVQRGDSLWRISRRILGKGLYYTEIYAANALQIRDPHKIYPGQVFVMPKGDGLASAGRP